MAKRYGYFGAATLRNAVATLDRTPMPEHAPGTPLDGARGALSVSKGATRTRDPRLIRPRVSNGWRTSDQSARRPRSSKTGLNQPLPPRQSVLTWRLSRRDRPPRTESDVHPKFDQSGPFRRRSDNRSRSHDRIRSARSGVTLTARARNERAQAGASLTTSCTCANTKAGLGYSDLPDGRGGHLVRDDRVAVRERVGVQVVVCDLGAV